MNFLERFSKNPQLYNFMKIRPVGDELFHADVQAGMMKLIDFRRFFNAHRKGRYKNRHVLVVKIKISHIKMSIPNYIIGRCGISACQVSTKPKETQLTFSSTRALFFAGGSVTPCPARTLNLLSDTNMLPTVAADTNMLPTVAADTNMLPTVAAVL